MSNKKPVASSAKTSVATKKVATKKTAAKKKSVEKATSEKVRSSSAQPTARKKVSSAKPAAKKTTHTPSQSKSKAAPRRAAPSSVASNPSPQKPEKSVQKSIDVSAVVPVASRFSEVPEHLDVDEGMDPGFLPTDEVMDETDYAQHMQLKEQASISLRARELNRPETHPDFDGQSCVECGEDIPPARLLLRRVRCVDCQTFLEEAAARTRRTSV